MAAQTVDLPKDDGDKQPEAKAEAPDGPAVVKPKRGGLPQTASWRGQFQAADRQEVYAAVPGTLRELTVDLGSRVKKGQLLARIDAPLLALAEKEAALAVRSAKAEVEEAKAAIQLAEAQVRPATAPRETLLQKRIALTKAEFKVEASELALEKARHALSLTRLVAAIDGVVTQRNFREGQYVQAGEGSRQLLLTIQGTGRARMVVSVPRQEALRIKPGMPAKIAFDPVTEFNPIECAVSRIGYALDEKQHMQVEIDVSDPKGQIRPGMTGNVMIELPGHPGAVRIPTSCLVRKIDYGTPTGRWSAVYVLRDGKPERTKVALGARDDKEVEILHGLKETDEVVTDPEPPGKAPPGRGKGKSK